jgi:hypothetical protein
MKISFDAGKKVRKQGEQIKCRMTGQQAMKERTILTREFVEFIPDDLNDDVRQHVSHFGWWDALQPDSSWDVFMVVENFILGKIGLRHNRAFNLLASLIESTA